MEFFSNPTSQLVINAAIGIVTIMVATIIPILIYRKQQNRKEITYEVISNESVLSINKEVKDKIKVLFNGKVVSDPNLLIIRIWNSGNQPIVAGDFIEPILITFDNEAKVFYSEILETEPSSIKDKAILKQDVASLSLEPLLLNSKESIKLKLLLNRSKTMPNISGRIVGGKIIGIKNDNFSLHLRTIFWALLFWILFYLTFQLLYYTFVPFINIKFFNAFFITFIFVEFTVLVGQRMNNDFDLFSLINERKSIPNKVIFLIIVFSLFCFFIVYLTNDYLINVAKMLYYLIRSI